MNDMEPSIRADPEMLLSAITKNRSRKKGGRLHLFIGMAPGVGKTYAMLLAAREALRSGIDMVIGVVETHGRKETEQLMEGFEVIPKKAIIHRDVMFHEMDIDAILTRKPNLVLVDELAHANIPGSRHQKRWQDVLELLDAGIDVYSTINIQHLESRKESVEKIANISISETVPDSVLDRAFQIQLIDLSVPDLLRRMKEGKIYLGEKAELAAANFFKEDRLTALREIALRVAAERVDADLQTYVAEKEVGSRGAVDRLMVAVGFSQNAETLIRTCRRLAYNLDAPWIAVHVSCNELVSDSQKATLKKNLDLARSLGAEVITLADTNVVDALTRIAAQKDVNQIVVGRSRKKLLRDVFGRGSIHEQLVDKSTVSIYIIGPKPKGLTVIFEKITSIKIKSTVASFTKAFFYSLALVGLNAGLMPYIGYRPAGFLFLLGVLVLGLFLPLGPVLFASIIMMAGWNFFFIPPVGTYGIKEAEDIFLCVSFLVAALATGVLTRRIKFQHEILVSREIRVQALNQILLDIALATTSREICAAVNRSIGNVLHGECNIVLRKKDGSLSAFINDMPCDNPSREMAVAKWAIENNKVAGHFTTTLSSAEAIYIPLKGSFEMLGALAFMAPGIHTLSIEELDFLYTVANQIAISLEKLRLRKRALESDRLAESERIQVTLLSLLCGEVRTCSGDAMSAGLSFTIDNVLLAARISSGVFPLRKLPCDLMDLVMLAAKKASAVLGKPLTMEIHGTTHFTKASLEPESMVQALANILLTAAQVAAGQNITVDVKPYEIKISSPGPDEKEEDLGRMFDMFSTEPYAQKTLGIGLAIAKGLVRAHEGKIQAQNRPSGGVSVIVSLLKP